MDKTDIENKFAQAIDEAREGMVEGREKGEGSGWVSQWVEDVGGVPCEVYVSWFADMDEIRDGRNLVLGECHIRIWPEIESS